MQLSATRVSAGASAGGPSLEASALAAIRRSGGWLHGIPASGSGLFTDSGASIQATAVGDVLGFVRDYASGSNATGENLYTGSDIVGVPIGGATFNNYPTGLTAEAGKAYEVTVDVTGYAGSGTFSIAGVTGLDWVVLTPSSGNQTWRFVAIALRNIAISFFTRSTNTANFTNIRIRQFFGLHATQAATANKPVIGTLANGRRAMRFDGANDFLSLPPPAVFSPHADHWAIAAFVKMGGDGLGQVLCGSSNTGNNNSLACQVFLDTTNTVRAIWRTDAGTSATVTTVGTVAIGSPTVVTAQRTSNTGTLRLNGVSVGTPQALPTSGITVNTANLGLSVRPVNASPLNGFAIVAAGNGTLQDTDRALIERYLAQQIGASLGA